MRLKRRTSTQRLPRRLEPEQHHDACALEELEILRPLIRHPRVAATVEHAIVVIREGSSETSRRLIGANLDDAVEWAREVREANERAAAYSLQALAVRRARGGEARSPQ
jgi:hypothetical protein